MPLADAQPKPNPVIEWMRSQVARIPESENTFSILNMARGGANTALNWLDATNRALQGYDPRGALEPADILAPLGLSAAGAPFAVRGAVGSAGGRLSAAQPGIRAYHGSPHDFDRFDMSKIGTGEGAQAYGHGLYFAESEDVARSYRDALQHKAPAKVEGVEGGARYLLQNAIQEARKYPKADRERVFREWLDETERMASGKFAPPGLAENVAEAKRLLASGEFVPDLSDAGRMYEVNIRANPDEFLDWDKPISQQPEAVEAAVWRHLESVLDQPGPIMDDVFERFERGEATGKDIVELFGDKKRATEVLREAGIPGIKYLDQGSRAAGEGTRNYVLFRDDIIDIIRKYGIAAAISTYGLEAVQGALGGQDARNTQRPIAPLGAPQF